MKAAVGAVVIGRDEGARLGRCLASLRGRVRAVVYADSGSRDGSVERAREAGVEVLGLDPGRPFSAARGRNEGLARLRRVAPEVAFVQFVDGDCTLRPGWIETACAALEARPDVAAVAGRLRERDPQRSIYHRLCEMEWDRAPGETDAVGGNAMMRLRALDEVGGFDPELPAGEEPELCLRLRRRGWRILRLEDEMMWHDADMTRFGQWWRRAERAGLALALAVTRPGRPAEASTWRRLASMLAFGVGLPAVAGIGLAAGSPAVVLACIAVAAVQGWRIGRAERRAGRAPADARLAAGFTLLGKVAGSLGIARGLWRARFSRVAHS